MPAKVVPGTLTLVLTSGELAPAASEPLTVREPVKRMSPEPVSPVTMLSDDR